MYSVFFELIFIKSCKFFGIKLKIFPKKFWRFGKKQYLCTRFRSKAGSGAKKERVL